MARLNLMAIPFLMMASMLIGQQGTIGVPGVNDLRINGMGSGGMSPVTVNLEAGDGVRALLYAIPFAPVLAFTADQVVVDAVPFTSTYSLDLDQPSMVVWVDGTGTVVPPNVLTPFSFTDQYGFFRLSGRIYRPRTLGIQFALVHSSLPQGFATSQAFDLVATPPTVCMGVVAGQPVAPLTDDGSINIPFPSGTTFTFYTVVYSDVYVNMNGNLTFGAGSSDFTPSEASFLANEPRIAPAWDDWAPSDPNQGTVKVYSGQNIFAVEWFDVRHYGSGCAGGVDSNTFCTILYMDPLGYITFGYGFMGLCGAGTSPSLDTIVGITPGLAFSQPNNIDMTAGTNVGTNASAMYEDFSQQTYGPFDMSHLSTVDASFLTFVSTSQGYDQILLGF